MIGRSDASVTEAESDGSGITQQESQSPPNQSASSSSDYVTTPPGRVATDGDTKRQSLSSVLGCPPPPAATQSDLDAYGLSGILRVVRFSNTPLSLLSLGMDLTALGLNLNAPELVLYV